MIVELLISGVLISAIYALATTGFTLLYGVSGILNLAHGTTLATAGMVAWYLGGTGLVGPLGMIAAGIIAGVVVGALTHLLIIRPIQRMGGLSSHDEHVFMLVGTLLWTIILQEGLALTFGDVPVSIPQLVPGVVRLFGVRTPISSLIVAVLAWGVICLLWLYVAGTRSGRSILAAAVNPRGLVLCGFDINRIHRAVWIVYGAMAGLAGVLIAMVLGVSPSGGLDLTASAFAIVVLGGLGSVGGSLVASNLIGFVETATAYLVGPSLRSLPALLILIAVLYFRPQGLFGRRAR
ncbi:MAG: branched-chain amino acid ABC transporter permease [Acetobacteraceae bacterium]|nr:branched-chain amino acid ABC transporter permease [Acetobacteraceae bacterium]